MVLSESAVFVYKCTDFYYPDDEGGIIWNDPAIGIAWPRIDRDYVLSDKDKKLPGFAAPRCPVWNRPLAASGRRPETYDLAYRL